jgi:ATP-binding cassette subfamily C protein CydCD
VTRPTRPEVPRATLAALAVSSVVRAGGLLLLAEGFALLIADGRDGLVAGAAFALAGLVLRALAGAATGAAGRRAAAHAKLGHRAALARGVIARDLDAGSVAVTASRGLDGLDAYYTSVVPAAVAAIVVPLGLGARILLADPLSALVLALTIPLVPVFMVLIGMHSRDKVEEAHAALTRLADHIAELAHGLPVLVGLGRDREQADRLAVIQEGHSRRTRLVLRTAFLSALALELVATLSVAVVAVVLGIRLISGGVGLFDALVVLLLAPECFTVLRELGAAHHAGQDGRTAFARVRELLAAPLPGERRRPGAPLTVGGLVVRFPGRRAAATARVDLTVRAGEIVALTGASGAGKSTVLGALAGVLPAEATVDGEVRLPDADLVAWVPQDPRCAAATVRAELERFAGGRDVDGIVAELGLGRVVDSEPSLLSPGELRRVAVARALLRVEAGAVVLLLDEPTAHLDAAAAGAVRRAVRARRARVATVLVSHDPETLALADRVVPLDASRPGVRDAVDEPVRDERDAAPTRGTRVAPVGLRPRTALALLLRPAPLTWLGGVLLAALATGMGLALTAVSAWLIVRASEQPAIMYLLVAIVGVRFFGLGRAVARYAERLVTHRAALGVADDLRARLWTGIARRGAGSRDLLEGGRAVDYLVGATGEVRDQLPRVIPPLAVGVLTVVGVTVTVGLVAPDVVVPVAVGLAVALALPLVLTLVAGRRAEADRVASGSELTRGFAAVGRSARDLRANGVADLAVRDLDARSLAAARAEARSSRAADLGVLAAPLLAGFTALLGATLLVGASAHAGIVAIVGLLVLSAGEPLAAAAAAAHRIPALATALGEVGRLLVPPVRAARGSERAPAVIDRLELDDVAVAWPGAATPVVAGLSGEAARGRWLVVEGPSGSGKSTLLTALLGDLDATAGRILAAGSDVASLDPVAWRARVAWCPQEAHVFDSTVRGNLVIGRPRDRAANDDELRAVLDRVGLAALVDALDAGLDGRVGPGGRWLSGGERQRLAVARALLADADVVLLDEPTAHLDAATARDLMSDLRRALADRVVVLVTHRADDVHADDAVLRLGRVDAILPHAA